MDPLAFANSNAAKRRRARPAAFLDAAPVLAVLLALWSAAGGVAQERFPDASAGPGAADTDAPAVTLEEVLALYNGNIRTALARIETLWVEQEIIEPSEDGEDRRAFAQLSYRQGERMKRTLLSSSLSYPSGNYQIASIVGPELLASEYVISLGGVEESEGRACYALNVTATERDITHFDGTVWATVDGCHLVRVKGEVADPPFPVARATFDKAFEPAPGGFWLVRRHSGWVEASLGFVKKQGSRHIFYGGYKVGTSDGLFDN